MEKLILVFSIFLVVSCGGGDSATSEVTADAELTGTVDFAQIPSSFFGVELEVTLEDTSLADAPAIVIATHRIKNITALPVQYSLGYSSAEIDDSFAYSVSARVYKMVNGKQTLLYISTTDYPVITHGWATEANVVVEKI